jgi:hypothetical protein
MTDVAIFDHDSAPSAVDGGAISNVPNWSDDSLYHGTNEATREGDLAVEGLRLGPLATIDAGVRSFLFRAKFRDNKEAMDAFLAPFVKAKILSEREARLGPASPKLSRLCKIGEYADQLRNEQIIQHLLETGSYGPFVLHQFAVLLDQLPSDVGNDERARRIVGRIRDENATTRHALLHLTKEMKKENRERHANASASVVQSSGSSVIFDGIPVTGPTRADVNFDLVIARTSRSDMRRLRDHYDEPLPRCLRTDDSVTDDAVMIVVAELSDLPVIVGNLLPHCGFEGVQPRIFLTQVPISLEVTGARTVIVAELGRSDRVRFSEIEWLALGEAIDLIALADRLVPDAKSKLNLFASAEADGWRSIIGEANWSQVDG